jgi:hypothetical protein
VTVGTTGPIGSGLPQLGLPRRFAMCDETPGVLGIYTGLDATSYGEAHHELPTNSFILSRLASKINRKTSQSTGRGVVPVPPLSSRLTTSECM